MDPQSRVEVIRRIIGAFADKDVGAFVANMADDIMLRPSAFITGRGEYNGKSEVISGFADMLEGFERTGERVEIRTVRDLVDGADDSTVLALCVIGVTRPGGETYDTDIAYLLRFEGDLVVELDAWLDHDEGLAQLKEPIEVEPARED